MGPKLPSRFQIGDEVRANGIKGTVSAVTFGEINGMGKVMYDVTTAGRTQYRVFSDDVGPVSPLGLKIVVSVTTVESDKES